MIYNPSKYFIFIFVSTLLLISCDTDKPQTKTPNKTDNVMDKSTDFERDQVQQDALNVEKQLRNPDWYTYDYDFGNDMEQAKNREKVPAEIADGIIDKVESNQNSNKNRKEAMTGMVSIYTVSETDRPPMFNVVCLTEKNPQQCSNEMIKDFIKENIKYPENAIEKNHDGLEVVSFVVNAQGEVEGNIKVRSKENPCKGCAKAAVEVVAKMKDYWLPAKKDGKAVRVKVTLPIRFETKNSI